jgi:hypothetical protein
VRITSSENSLACGVPRWIVSKPVAGPVRVVKGHGNRRQVASVDQGIVTHYAAVADMAGPDHNRAVRDRGMPPDRHGGAGLRVDDHPVLNVRVGTDHHGFHLAPGVDLVCTDNDIRPHEYILVNDYLAEDDCGLIDLGRLIDHRQIAGGVLADHPGVPG